MPFIVFIEKHLKSFNDFRCPSTLLTLDLKGSDKFSLYEIINYLESNKFKSDIDACTLDYDEAIYNRLSPYLVLEKDSDNELILKLKTECIL